MQCTDYKHVFWLIFFHSPLISLLLFNGIIILKLVCNSYDIKELLMIIIMRIIFFTDSKYKLNRMYRDMTLAINSRCSFYCQGRFILL
jgi:hypothetical protein